MRLLCALLIAIAVSSPAGAESAAPSESRGTESVGDQLLDELPTSIPSKSPATGAEQPQSGLRRTRPSPSATPRFDDLGKDIGAPPGPLPLVRAQQGMQRASALLGKSTTASDTHALQQTGTVQRQVVAQLDQLIAELSKQCQGGQCPPSDQQPGPSQRSHAEPGKTSGSQAPGQSTARDSSDRLDRKNTEAADMVDVNELAKGLWGHLPERSRDEMLQSFSDEFLPKYELEIEAYYRRLSEKPE